ncbi:MAG: PA2169 family four-helix-bundle protein [Planctomycetota bacterium]
MSLETKLTLSDSTISELQELTQVNIDSRDALNELASKTEDISIANLFQSLATQRNQQASELQSLVRLNCEEPRESGSFAGAARQTLIDIRAALGGGTKVMLIEAEKCEDKIKGKYEDALENEPGTAVSDILHRQLAAVKVGHDRVRDMRDAYHED